MSDVIQELVLRPRDGLFLKDGRGWYTSGAGRAYSHDWPPPSTLLGALRGGYGRTQENGTALCRKGWLRIADQVCLGDSLALRIPLGEALTVEHRLWPAPADALYLEGKDDIHRLDPEPHEPGVGTLGCDPDDPAREALWRPVLNDQSKPEPAPKWWTEADFIKWLRGQTVRKLTTREEWPDPPRRVDVHVAIEPGQQAAKEGALFSHDVVETLSWRDPQTPYEWAIACRAGLPDDGDLNGQLLTLGGKRRLCRAEAAPDGLFGPPVDLLSALDGAVGLRLVVVTPAEFEQGWLPDGLARVGDTYRGRLTGWPGGPEVILRAAFVGRPMHLSGWDMQNRDGKAKPGPKRTRRLVAPGAVYFLVPAEGEAFTADQVQSLWLAGLGLNTREGFGRVVPGVWTPAKKEGQGG